MPATDKYPWSGTEISAAYAAARKYVEGFDHDDIRELLRGFAESGIQVSFPKYWVRVSYKGSWFVIRGDGTGEDDHVACFEPGHPSPEASAKAEAYRLNGNTHSAA